MMEGTEPEVPATIVQEYDAPDPKPSIYLVDLATQNFVTFGRGSAAYREKKRFQNATTAGGTPYTGIEAECGGDCSSCSSMNSTGFFSQESSSLLWSGDEDPIDLDETLIPELKESSASQAESQVDELEEEEEQEKARLGVLDVDLKVIQPYRGFVSHGGYVDDAMKIPIIVFCGRFLPDRNVKEYPYVMDQLFLYVLAALEEFVKEEYVIVYLQGDPFKGSAPQVKWLRKSYDLINYRLRKNIKGLYVVHPTIWMKIVMAVAKLFVSAKFWKKVHFIKTLADLKNHLPTEHLVISEEILKYDATLKKKT